MNTGKIWKFSDHVDTDQIIASQYLLLPTIDQMKAYTFENLMPQFAERFQKGDVIVVGENFGCGSSREQAPRVLKAVGVGAVIGKSFARIFFRNSINIGLPLIQCSELHEKVSNGDILSYDLDAAVIKHSQREYRFNRFPEHVLKIIRCGGLIQYINHLEQPNELDHAE
jgi:3-isopropylmalate/(R)-2-methylmalate dehydratase small subunit